MSSLVGNVAFQVYVVAAAILAFNLNLLGNLTALARAKYKSPVTPEDVRPGGAPFNHNAAPEVERLLRAHRNAVENVPIGLISGLIYVLAGASSTAASIGLGAFTAGRVLHSFFYLKAMQPWRSSAHIVAALAALGMAIHAVVLVLRAA